MENKNKKIYAVDVHWDVAKCYHIEAESREEAEKKITELINNGGVNVHTDGFEATDDVEVHCSGETNSEGEMEYD